MNQISYQAVRRRRVRQFTRLKTWTSIFGYRGLADSLGFLVSVILGILSASTLTASSAIPSVEVPVEAWVRRDGPAAGATYGDPGKVVVDSLSDDFVVASGAMTVKYSGWDGSGLWTNLCAVTDKGLLDLSALAVDSQGDVLVAGGMTGGWRYVAKYAGDDGALVWEQYDSNWNSSKPAIAIDADNNVLVTGIGATTRKYTAANGLLIWEILVGGAVAMAADGDVLLATEYWTGKFAAADGTLVRTQPYTWHGNHVFSETRMAVDGVGNVFVIRNEAVMQIKDLRLVPLGSYLVKHTANGAQLWEQHYADGYARDLALGGDGHVVVIGNSHFEQSCPCPPGAQGCAGSCTATDHYTAKYAATDGALMWERHYAGHERQANDGTEEPASGCAVDSDGNVFVAGYTFQTNSGSCFYLAQYAAADGTVVWEKFGPRGGATLALASGGGHLIVSDRRSYSFTARFQAWDGALVWERCDACESYAQAVASLDVDGNVVVAGYSHNGTNFDYYTAIYAAGNGALRWSCRYNGPANGDDKAIALAVDDGGVVFVAGNSSNGTNTDYCIVKYQWMEGMTWDGLHWERRYNGPADGDDEVVAVSVAPEGNVVVTGTCTGIGSGIDFYTAKYASTDGAVLWERYYNGPASGQDQPSALAVDSNGDVIVAGTSEGDFYTAKYAAADGAVVWERRFNGPNGFFDRADSVALDSGGNIFVAGQSDYEWVYNPLWGQVLRGGEWYIAKYAAANGALIWETRFDAGATDDSALAIATVDHSGDVVISGDFHKRCWSFGPCWSSNDCLTAKFSGHNGALLWERHHYSWAHSPLAHAAAATVDASNNVVVAWSPFDGTSYNYVTKKFAAADGALLWEKYYDGPGNPDDFIAPVRGLGLSPDGAVIVTGTSGGDVATVKYATYITPIVLTASRTTGGPTGDEERLYLRFTGDPGRTYRLQSAWDPAGPWTTFATYVAPADGVVEHPVLWWGWLIRNSIPTFYRVAAP